MDRPMGCVCMVWRSRGRKYGVEVVSPASAIRSPRRGLRKEPVREANARKVCSREVMGMWPG